MVDASRCSEHGSRDSNGPLGVQACGPSGRDGLGKCVKCIGTHVLLVQSSACTCLVF